MLPQDLTASDPYREEVVEVRRVSNVLMRLPQGIPVHCLKARYHSCHFMLLHNTLPYKRLLYNTGQTMAKHTGYGCSIV